MNELILHHFTVSPFSEKVRLVLGYKGLSWMSVIIPAIMPKPNLVALTGGYRKTPVLQIGADVFCDTSLICDVLERLAPSPTLYPARLEGLSRTVAQWADSTLFWAAIAGPKMPSHLYGGMGADAAGRFADDRNAMFQNMARPRPADASAARLDYVRRLADMLSGRPYLLGDEPSLADFAAVHPLWFTRIPEPESADLLHGYPELIQWLSRVRAFGHGGRQEIDAGTALEIAAVAEPAALGSSLLPDTTFRDDHGIPLGSLVGITAESFGSERTQGELIAASRSHFSVRRVDAIAGTVHVHFPRIGYVLERSTEAVR